MKVKVIYVETCPQCDCAVVRSPDGERTAGPSPALPAPPAPSNASCAGCACHREWPIAAGS